MWDVTMENSDHYIYWLYRDMPGMLDILFHRAKAIDLIISEEKIIGINVSSYEYIAPRNVKSTVIREIGSIEDKWYEVWMELVNDSILRTIPMNPLFPNRPLAARSEAEDMVATIMALGHGVKPNLDPNPYHRELKRQGREDEISKRLWDPSVSPWFYYHEDHPRAPIWKVILQTLITILAIAVGLALMIAVMEALT